MLASEFDTVEELREDIKSKLQGNRLVEQGYEAREKVAEKLVELVDFPLPERFLQAQVDEHFSDGHGDEDHRKEVEDNTRTSLKTQLILDRIADTEELTVEQGELIQWLVQQAPRYGMSPDQFANALAEAGQVGTAMADVRRGKALAMVMQKATVTDASGNPVDLTELDRRADAFEEAAEAIVEEELDEVDGDDADDAEAATDADK
jgi:trigger factor